MKANTDNSGAQSRSLSEAEREALFKRLHLAHMRRIYQEVAVQAEKEGWSYADFLTLLLAEEVAGRKQTRLQRLTRSAHFPFLKTMEEFDFSLQSTLRLTLLGSYLGPELVSEGRSLILHGKTGRGKTHLAVAIGYRAIQNGFETLFTTAAELIEDLSNASKQGRLQESLATYTRPHVLVIDEVGYLTYAQDAANVLFHVVNNRHLRKRPMIFTTNKPLNEWGKVLHDEDLAAAILDRVLERGRFIRLDGPSGRTRHLKLEDSLPGTSERLRISGNNGSEFPEPTSINLLKQIDGVLQRAGWKRGKLHGTPFPPVIAIPLSENVSLQVSQSLRTGIEVSFESKEPPSSLQSTPTSKLPLYIRVAWALPSNLASHLFPLQEGLGKYLNVVNDTDPWVLVTVGKKP